MNVETQELYVIVCQTSVTTCHSKQISMESAAGQPFPPLANPAPVAALFKQGTGNICTMEMFAFGSRIRHPGRTD